MRGLAVAACFGIAFAGGAPVAAQTDEPFRPKGRYNDSVHRFFPDLDSRLNAVRYARWQALEIAWVSGINPRLDRQFSASLLSLLGDPPRFPPEPDRVAPRFAREAPSVFRALRWGQTFEQQVIDIFASPDATPALTGRRLRRALDLYRRERYALSEPSDGSPPSAELLRLAPVSGRILASGTRLFARAAENLVTGDFGQQRWRVRDTIGEYDRSYAGEPAILAAPYSSAAPGVASLHPEASGCLDRIARFRAALFAALIPGGEVPQGRRRRDEAVRALARLWGLPVEGLGAP